MNSFKKIISKYRVLIIIVLIGTLIFGACRYVLGDFAMFYSVDMIEDGLEIKINYIGNSCYISGYECTDFPDGKVITIANDYDGVPIKKIGGYFGRGVPDPFEISMSEVINAEEGSRYANVWYGDITQYKITEAYTIEDVVFELNIGKNIKEIEKVEMDAYYPHINDDGSITFYHPVVYVKCSEENKKFYSEDGKLYYKSSDKLVEKFEYAE